MRRVAWRGLSERLCATVVLLLTSARMWWQPILADETDFMSAAVHWPSLAHLIPHPPGYIQLIRVAFRLMGASIGSARAVGVLSGIVSIWMMPAIARSLFEERERAERIARWSIVIAALSPLVLQNMMLLDIDNTVATPATLWALLVWWRSGSWRQRARVLAMGAVLGADAWFKLPPPLLLAGAIAVDATWSRRWRDLIAILLAVVLGALLFVLVFDLHRRVTGFGFGEMQGTFRKLAWLADLSTTARRLPQTVGVTLLWLSPGLVILWLVGAMPERAATNSPWQARRRLAVTFTLLVMGFYAVALPPAWGYPKYQAIAFPLIAVVAAAALDGAVRALPKAKLAWLAGLAVAGLLMQLTLVGDPLLRAYRVTSDTSIGQLGQRAGAGIVAFALAGAYVALAALLSITVAHFRGWSRISTGIAFLGVTLLGALAGTSLLQSRADYSTRYHYGTSYAALTLACRRLRTAVSDSGFVVAPKEVLYYSGLKGEVVYGYVWETASPDSLLFLTQRRRVDAFVWTAREEHRARRVLDDPRVMALLKSGYTADSMGEYFLWIRRGSASMPSAGGGDAAPAP